MQIFLNGQIYEITIGKAIGKKQRSKYIWYNCTICGNPRWVELRKGIPKSRTCRPCSCKKNIIDARTAKSFYWGEHNPRWKGGLIRKGSSGYLREIVAPQDFFSPMAQSGGYVLQHRLIMARYLKRCLFDWEVVHHKNGIKDDNRIENLALSTKNAHIKDHHMGYTQGYREGYADGQNKRINELQQLLIEQTKEIRIIQWQLKQSQIKVGG